MWISDYIYDKNYNYNTTHQSICMITTKHLSFILLILFFFDVKLTAQTQTVKVWGYMTEAATDEPALSTVVVKRTQTGVCTDGYGLYEITAEIGDTLVFQLLGMVTEERRVDATINLLNVEMTELPSPFMNEHPLRSHSRSQQITGIITSGYDNLPLPDALILLKGTSKDAVADIDGRYSINALPGDTLVFRYIGMLTQERLVFYGTNQMDIRLEEDIYCSEYGSDNAHLRYDSRKARRKQLRRLNRKSK